MQPEIIEHSSKHYLKTDSKETKSETINKDKDDGGHKIVMCKCSKSSDIDSENASFYTMDECIHDDSLTKEYGILANIILGSISKEQVDMHKSLEEIKAKISEEKAKSKISLNEFKFLEAAVSKIKSHLELDNEQSHTSNKSSGTFFISKYTSHLYEALKNILFGDKEEVLISEETFMTDEKDISPSKQKDHETENELHNICNCFIEKRELPTQTSIGVFHTALNQFNRPVKTSISIDSKLDFSVQNNSSLKGIIQSFESLNESRLESNNLKKFKGENDLTKVKSTAALNNENFLKQTKSIGTLNSLRKAEEAFKKMKEPLDLDDQLDDDGFFNLVK